MSYYIINIAKAHTLEDWQGIPAHVFHAKIELSCGISEKEAVAELERQKQIFEWPHYYVSLRRELVVTEVNRIASNAPEEWLKTRGGTA